MLNDPVITMISALVLSYVFVLAGLYKFQHLPEFRSTLENYQLFPGRLILPLSLLVPAIETAAGLGLLIPVSSGPAAITVGLLLSLYMAAITINLLRKRRNIDCGCLGSLQRQTLSEWLIVRNLLLLGLVYLTLATGAQRPLQWLDWLVIVLATAIACLFYNIGNQLLVNRDKLKLLRSDHG